MKKGLFGLLFSTSLFGFAPELRVSYFYFSDVILREIYDTGQFYPQVGFLQPVCGELSAWTSVGYLYKEGQSIGGKDRTTISLVPVNFGVKYFFHPAPLHATMYLGGGGSFFHVGFHNDNEFVLRDVYRNGLGIFVAGGGIWSLASYLDLDLFIEYTARRTNSLEHKEGTVPYNLEMGGWDFGLGLGYTF